MLRLLAARLALLHALLDPARKFFGGIAADAEFEQVKRHGTYCGRMVRLRL